MASGAATAGADGILAIDGGDGAVGADGAPGTVPVEASEGRAGVARGSDGGSKPSSARVSREVSGAATAGAAAVGDAAGTVPRSRGASLEVGTALLLTAGSSGSGSGNGNGSGGDGNGSEASGNGSGGSNGRSSGNGSGSGSGSGSNVRSSGEAMGMTSSTDARLNIISQLRRQLRGGGGSGGGGGGAYGSSLDQLPCKDNGGDYGVGHSQGSHLPVPRVMRTSSAQLLQWTDEYELYSRV